MKTLFGILLIFLGITGFAQLPVKGVVRDKNSLVPIDNAYVSLGETKTTTDPEGRFSFEITGGDSVVLKISHVSYGEKIERLRITDGIMIIELSPQVTELREVVVSAAKKSTIRLGASAKKPAIVYFGHVKGDIQLLKIKNESPPPGHYLKRLNYYFVQSNKTLGKGYNGASFLIKVYEIDDVTSLPGRELTKSEIKVTSKARNKWMSVDLTEFKIPLPLKPFFIGVQFLEDRGFQTPSGFTQIEPCFGGTNEFGSEALCYSLRDMQWSKSAQNIMISVDAGEINDR